MHHKPVLIVEDDSSIRELIRTLLSREGFDVDCARDGVDAVSLIASNSYTAIVVDLMMPRLTGVDLLAELSIAREDLLPRLIVVTGVSDAALRRLDLAAAMVLRKPFNIVDLVEAVRARLTIRDDERTPLSTSQRLGELLAKDTVAIGAAAGLIAISGESPGCLTIRCSHGIDSETLDRFFPAPFRTAIPVCVAFRTGAPIWYASITRAEADYPLLLPIWKKRECHAIAAIPLRDGARVLGAVGWSFRDHQPFDGHQQQEIVSTAARYSRIVRLAGWSRELPESSAAL